MVGSGEAAFFDLDKTIITKAALGAFGKPLLDAGLVDRRLVVIAAYRNLLFEHLGASEARMDKMRAAGLRLIEGWDAALITAIVRDTLVDRLAPLVYPQAQALLDTHRAAGRRLFLVSASPTEIVEPVAEHLGMDEVICSRADVDERGRYTGVAFWSSGEHKAVAVRAAADRLGLDLERCFAYSDSATDLPLLGCVGHPVAVNPDRALARVARTRGWPIERFTAPRRSRSAVGRPTPARVA